MTAQITSFQREFRFLSNFYMCPVPYECIIYPSAEHAFVAAKCLEPWTRLEISNITSPGEVKKFGRNIKLRENWDNIRIGEMGKIVFSKFSYNPMLREALLLTKDAELIEGNWWGDKFWGMCNGEGENHLGKILMKVRAELRQ